jgi:hypothetical protein
VGAEKLSKIVTVNWMRHLQREIERGMIGMKRKLKARVSDANGLVDHGDEDYRDFGGPFFSEACNRGLANEEERKAGDYWIKVTH